MKALPRVVVIALICYFTFLGILGAANMGKIRSILFPDANPPVNHLTDPPRE